MLSPGEIADINARVDLRDLAERLGAQFRRGRKYGSCPICGGGKSATRFEFKGVVWVCAACGKGGDAIALLREVKGFSFVDAVRELGGEVALSAEERERRETAEA
jgi:DNA primase